MGDAARILLLRLASFSLEHGFLFDETLERLIDLRLAFEKSLTEILQIAHEHGTAPFFAQIDKIIPFEIEPQDHTWLETRRVFLNGGKLQERTFTGHPEIER